MSAAIDRPRVGGGARVALGATLGAVAGFVLGVAVAGSLWLWAFAQGLSGSPVHLPGLVTVQAGDDVTSAQAGPLLLLLPLIGAVVLGLVVALAVAGRRARVAGPTHQTGSASDARP
jgi:hypothetical protein